MAIASRIRLFYLTHISKPSADRVIYRAILRYRVTSILEIGVGLAARAERMIELAAQEVPRSGVRYTGIDLFEARPPKEGPGLSLKEAHRVLRSTGAVIRLCPGDPFTALSCVANSLGPTDLVVVSAALDRPSMAKAWFFVPRILHARSLVFVEKQRPSEGGAAFRLIGSDEIESMAARRRLKRAA